MTLVYKYDVKRWGAVLALLLVLVARAAAQTPTGSVRGQVTDPSGAVIAGATVVVLPADGASSTATTRSGTVSPARRPSSTSSVTCSSGVAGARL